MNAQFTMVCAIRPIVALRRSLSTKRLAAHHRPHFNTGVVNRSPNGDSAEFSTRWRRFDERTATNLCNQHVREKQQLPVKFSRFFKLVLDGCAGKT
jgi:hypothetical protein